ncbi:MAG: N-acetylmuramoyl-L-alanine amidase [Bacteroidota bacterium]
MRTTALCLLGLIVLTLLGSAAPGQVPSATLDGKAIPGLSVAVFENEPYIALSSLPLLHINVVHDKAQAQAVIGIGRRTILMTAGSTAVTVDGQPDAAKQAPMLERGEFWVPAAYLGRLSLKAAWKPDKNTVALEWNRSYFIGARLDATGAFPKLVIEATHEIKATVFKLGKPDRLVIDMRGLSVYDSPLLDDRENEYFERLRAGMFLPGVLRLVLDLRQPVGYRVDGSLAKEGRLAVEFNTLVYGVAVEPAEEGHKLTVTTNHQPQWKAVAFAEPDRIVIDLDRATLAVPAGTTPGGDDWLRAAEYRAVDQDRVQVTAFLAKQQSCAVTMAPGHDNVIEVQPLQNLGRISWAAGGGSFSLTSTGALAIATNVQHYPERLELTIFHAAAVPEEGERNSGPVRRYKVHQVMAGVMRITLDLRYDAQYTMEFSPDRRQITVSFQPSPLAGKVIVLDAGHGGVETGALGRTTGLREKDINLDVTLRLKELLEDAGASVYLTRIDDTYVPLFSRASYANRLPSEIFISIHSNAHDDPAVNGVETFYYPKKEGDQRLACLMLEEMVAALGLHPRGAKANDFAVLRDSQIVSILIELGFLTNAQEEARLATDDFRRLASLAIFRAVTRYARGETTAGGPPGPGL